MRPCDAMMAEARWLNLTLTILSHTTGLGYTANLTYMLDEPAVVNAIWGIDRVFRACPPAEEVAVLDLLRGLDGITVDA